MGDDDLRGDAGDDTLDGGEGADLLSYAGSFAPVTIDLAAGTAVSTGFYALDADDECDDTPGVGDPCVGPAGDATDRVGGFEAVLGTRSADVIRGGDGPDLLVGGGGDDSISGLGGDDTLLGGGGDDLLIDQ